MNRQEIEKEVTVYLDPIAEGFGYEVIDVEFVKEGASYYLRIYLDKEGGIDVEDCRKTSRALEAVLDEKDPIKEPYILEVSSPGLDRVLKKDKEFEKYAGRIVDVKLYKPLNKQKHYQGELVKKTDTQLYIIDEQQKELVFEMENVVTVRLAILF